MLVPKMLVIEGKKYMHVFSTNDLFTYVLIQRGKEGTVEYATYTIEHGGQLDATKVPELWR